MKIKAFIKTFVVFVILVFIYSIPAWGQESRTITISPPTINLSLNPGDTYQGTLRVINGGTTPLTFNASAKDFVVKDTKGTPDFINTNSLGKQFSLSSWISISPNNFTLNPKQDITLSYFINVPSSVSSGGHYTGIIYSPNLSSNEVNNSTSVETQVATLLYVDISGAINEKAVVTRFSSEHVFYEYGHINLLTQIKNLGDLHIKPIGNITIYNILGQKLAVLPLEQHNIFPSASRDYVNRFSQQFMIGPFTAKFAGNYGRNANLPLIANITFWVFPWKIAVVVILLIIAVTLAVLLFLKRKPNTPRLSSNDDAASSA